MQVKQPGDYRPIADYGLIGNLHTTALVSREASIDFFCFPRFDSPTVFGALLDRERGGRFCITPQLSGVELHQQYLPNTNVLLSRFLAEEGMAEVTDFFRVDAEHPERGDLMRSVKVIRGEVSFVVRCAPRFDYSRVGHELRGGHGDAAHEGEDQRGDAVAFVPAREDLPRLRLVSDRDLVSEGDDDTPEAVARFTLGEGETAHFLLDAWADAEADGADRPSLPEPGHLDAALDRALHETIAFWKHWVGQSTYRGEWTGPLRRSALALKLLTSAEFGAPVAAATFGLPEELGGERNWDYRYTWLRDAAFALYALISIGFDEEAGKFMDWLTARCQEADGSLQPLYSLNGQAKVHEEELTHLSGYRGSCPVRLGNDAYGQLQLDIYGAVMDAAYLYNKWGAPLDYDLWHNMRRIMDWLANNWQQPDEGMWEVRGGRQQFVSSKVMAWVALERAVRISHQRGLPAGDGNWIRERDKIYEDIMQKGWNPDKESFVQHYGSNALDASLLMMPLVKFVGPTDPRWISTLDRIQEELTYDTLVDRYNVEDAASDGLSGSEGSFSLCSFWYVECLAKSGRVEEARLALEKMFSYANHLGLYAEEIGRSGEALGNFPQAFTHLSLISAAIHLDRALGSS